MYINIYIYIHSLCYDFWAPVSVIFVKSVFVCVWVDKLVSE